MGVHPKDRPRDNLTHRCYPISRRLDTFKPRRRQLLALSPKKPDLLRHRRRGACFGFAYRTEEEPPNRVPMIGAKLPDAAITIALHDRAL
jgi:hypothetical protein